MQFFTGISSDTQVKIILCYHWLSVSGISKIMHCGILINMLQCFVLGVWRLNTRKELYRLSPLHNTIGNSVYKSWSSWTERYHGQNLVDLSFAHILLIRVNEGLFYYILVKKVIKRSPIKDILQGSEIHVSLFNFIWISNRNRYFLFTRNWHGK